MQRKVWQKKEEEIKIGCAGVPEQATPIQFSSECLLWPPIVVITILKKFWMLLKSFGYRKKGVLETDFANIMSVTKNQRDVCHAWKRNCAT